MTKREESPKTLWVTFDLRVGQQVGTFVEFYSGNEKLKTGRVKEHVYKYRHAARNKTRKLINEGNKEITIVQQDSVHFIDPRYNDIFDDY